MEQAVSDRGIYFEQGKEPDSEFKIFNEEINEETFVITGESVRSSLFALENMIKEVQEYFASVVKKQDDTLDEIKVSQTQFSNQLQLAHASVESLKLWFKVLTVVGFIGAIISSIIVYMNLHIIL